MSSHVQELTRHPMVPDEPRLCQYMKRSHKKSLVTCGRGFVNTSARFVFPSSFVTRIVPAATASLVRWYAIALCFFFQVDSGKVAFLVTASLSQNTFVGPSIGTPNIRNLYRNDSTSSTAILIATNSLPNVEVSTVF
jgi:hypothetical protein